MQAHTDLLVPASDPWGICLETELLGNGVSLFHFWMEHDRELEKSLLSCLEFDSCQVGEWLQSPENPESTVACLCPGRKVAWLLLELVCLRDLRQRLLASPGIHIRNSCDRELYGVMLGHMEGIMESPSWGRGLLRVLWKLQVTFHVHAPLSSF